MLNDTPHLWNRVKYLQKTRKLWTQNNKLCVKKLRMVFSSECPTGHSSGLQSGLGLPGLRHLPTLHSTNAIPQTHQGSSCLEVAGSLVRLSCSSPDVCVAHSLATCKACSGGTHAGGSFLTIRELTLAPPVLCFIFLHDTLTIPPPCPHCCCLDTKPSPPLLWLHGL